MTQRWMHRLKSDSENSLISAIFSSAVWIFVKKYWFLLSIVGAILFAHAYPNLGRTGGPLHPEIVVKYIAISTIFFNSGLSLKSKDLLDALLYAKLHVYVQGFSLLFIPIFMAFLVHLFETADFLSDELLQGLTVLGCMPTPVGTSVILTKAAGGNEAAAVFNSAFGSALGVIVTPLLILNLLGSAVEMSLTTIIGKLSLTVVLPVVIGQLVRIFTVDRLSFVLPHLNIVNSIALLLIIFSTFSDTFYLGTITLDAMHIILMILVVCLVHSALLYTSFSLSQYPPFSFTPSDVVAVTFSSTQKSLTLGIPIIKIIFPDIHRQSLLAIPLLIQEPAQILIGGIIVPHFKSWLQGLKSDWSSKSTPDAVLVSSEDTTLTHLKYSQSEEPNSSTEQDVLEPTGAHQK